MSEQPKALKLADDLEQDPSLWGGLSKVAWPAAAELRRLHAENEALRVDAECFRFWVREAAQAPGGMASLIAKCVTEQDYRDAIMPCVHRANAAITRARRSA